MGETCASCGHSQHSHVNFTRGCGLCDCLTFIYRRTTFEEA